MYYIIYISKTYTCIHIAVPPDIPDNDLNGNITVKEGETVCFVCNASGIPQPEVSWYRLTSTKPPIKRTCMSNFGVILFIFIYIV